MVGLSGVLVAETRKYLWGNRLFQVDKTLLSEKNEENSEKTEKTNFSDRKLPRGPYPL